MTLVFKRFKHKILAIKKLLLINKVYKEYEILVFSAQNLF